MTNLVIMRRFFVYVLFGSFVSFSASTVLAADIHAASVFDDLPLITQTLTLKAGVYESPGLEATWQSYAIEECNGFAERNPDRALAVIQAKTGPSVQVLYIVEGKTNDSPITWIESAGTYYALLGSSDVQWRWYMTLSGEGQVTCDKEYESSVLMGVQTPPNPPSEDYQLFFNTFSQNYPTGYEGPLLEVSKPLVRPDFSYVVNAKDIQATDHGKDLPTFEPDPGYKIKGYHVEWTLFECAGGFDPVAETCSGDLSLKDHKIQKQEDNYSYKVDLYGNYRLEAQYLVQECYRYPSYPATPDHCFYADLGQELPGYDFVPTRVNLKIDGSSISGDTRDDDCAEDGFCSPPSPYEDCSTYGVDLLGGFTCVMGNFGKWLAITLKMLFIPSGIFMQDYFENFMRVFTDLLGFLLYPITFTIQLFTEMWTASDTCSVVLASGVPGANPSGTFFGATPNINVCSAQTHLPAVYNIAVFFTRVVTVVGLIYALYHRYFELLERRDPRKGSNY